MMNYFLPVLILIVLAILYAGSLQKSSSRLMVVVIVLALILVLCWMQMRGNGMEGFNGYSPLGYNMRIAGQDGSAPVGCGGYDYAGINAKVGNAGYDGLRLKSNMVTKPLLNDVTIFSPVGDGYKLGEALGSENATTIDGQPGSPKSMFVLKNSQVSWDCCPSIHSSDMGCVCTSEEQMNMFAGRGGNRSAPDTYPSM